MEDFEKLGAFYLGRPFDLAKKKPKDGIVLYDSKDLLTHAVCVGMTGSGKTGLCIDLLDRKSTRLNSSHLGISYAVFCLKKKKKNNNYNTTINKAKRTK